MHLAQVKAADVLRKAFHDVLMSAGYHFHLIVHNSRSGGMSAFERDIDHLFAHAAKDLDRIQQRLRASSYTLAKSSEAEIIGQVTKKKSTAHVSRTHADLQRFKRSISGGQTEDRIKHYLNRIKHKIIQGASTASLAADQAIGPETQKDFLMQVYQAFPKTKTYRRPPRALQPVTEADTKKKVDASIDLIDQNEWQQMLDDYKEEYVPKWRGPESVVDIPITDPTVQATTGEEVWYAWEFERDLVNEFVSSVREGELDAANENGITDFVWIAVIDNATDDCCSWRDGLLTSEIQAKLDEEGEDDCPDGLGEGITPPIHFNCRCTLAPATDEIPDRPDDGEKDFQDWLTS